MLLQGFGFSIRRSAFRVRVQIFEDFASGGWWINEGGERCMWVVRHGGGARHERREGSAEYTKGFRVFGKFDKAFEALRLSRVVCLASFAPVLSL